MTIDQMKLMTAAQLLDLVDQLANPNSTHRRLRGQTSGVSYAAFGKIAVTFRPGMKAMQFSIDDHRTQCRSEGRLFQKCIRSVMGKCHYDGTARARGVNDYSLHGTRKIDDDWGRLSATLMLLLYYEFHKQGVLPAYRLPGKPHK